VRDLEDKFRYRQILILHILYLRSILIQNQIFSENTIPTLNYLK